VSVTQAVHLGGGTHSTFSLVAADHFSPSCRHTTAVLESMNVDLLDGRVRSQTPGGASILMTVAGFLGCPCRRAPPMHWEGTSHLNDTMPPRTFVGIQLTGDVTAGRATYARTQGCGWWTGRKRLCTRCVTCSTGCIQRGETVEGWYVTVTTLS